MVWMGGVRAPINEALPPSQFRGEKMGIDKDATELKKLFEATPIFRPASQEVAGQRPITSLQNAMQDQVRKAVLPSGFTIDYQGSETVITNTNNNKSCVVPLFAAREIVIALRELLT